jgi:hypothetical protein
MPITKNTPIGTVVKDFEKSKAPQFAGKSKAKRAQMGVAAALHAKNPSGSKKKTAYENKIGEVHAALKPYKGCTVAGMVKEINPIEGLAPHSISMEEIHGLYPNKEHAAKVAESLYAEHSKKLAELEEKKEHVSGKITKAIDTLEKKRKDHVDMAKEDPKNSRVHKEHIAKLAHQIDDLMDKLERVEKSKKPVKHTKEEKKDKKK